MVDDDSKLRNGVGYTYYAFVSYSHRDAKWATWIQNALERYRLPSSVRKSVRKPLPKRLAPVFRDATDLGTGQLVDGLHQELEASRFLIVICSPDSAKPNAEGKHYVDHEVDYFAGLGRGDRIIPVIVSGTSKESFSPKVRELDFKAIDATKASRARVLNDIVAKILGLRPDELWRRERRRQLIRRIELSVLGAVAALVVAVGGLFAWESKRTVVRNYVDYVERWGLPEGIFPLSDEEVSHRSGHFRFEYQGLRFGPSIHADRSGPSFFGMFGFRRVLRRVISANSAGYPFREISQGQAETPINEFVYDPASGRLCEIRGFNFRAGRVVSRTLLSNKGPAINAVIRSFSGDLMVPLMARNMDDNFDGGALEGAAASFGLSVGTDILSDSVSHVCLASVVRNEEGLVREMRYLDAFGRPACLKNEWFGAAFQYDAYGRVSECLGLRKDGTRLVDGQYAVAAVGSRFYYSGPNPAMIWPLGPGGGLFVDRFLKAGSAFSCDRWGNVVKYNNFIVQPDGQLVNFTRGNGVTEVLMSYDDKGQCTNSVARGLRSALEVEHVLWSERYRHDEFGRVVFSSGRDTGSGMSVHARYEYDAIGRLRRTTNLDESGRPKNPDNGCSIVSFEYDGLNEQPSRVRSYNKDGELCPSGVPPIRDLVGYDTVYTESGLREQQTFIGTNGLMAVSKELGYARICFTPDHQGRHVETVRYYDDQGLPTRDREHGVYGIHHVYDKEGDVRKAVEYIDENGALMMDVNGVAGYKSKFDASGREICRRYYNSLKQPAADKKESYGWDEICDANGNLFRDPVGKLDFWHMPRLKKSTLPDSAPKFGLNG